MMAEPKKHGINDSTGQAHGKEMQARVDKAAVVLALAEEPQDAGPCLSDEELALFASGGGSHGQTARWLRHAGLCSSCREQWLLVRESLEHLGHGRGRLYRLSVFRSLRSLRSIGLTLAAAASVAVYLQIVKAPGPMEETRAIAPQEAILPPPAPPARERKEEEQMEEPVQPAAPAARTTSPLPLPDSPAIRETLKEKSPSSSPAAKQESDSSGQEAGGSAEKAPPAREGDAGDDANKARKDSIRRSAAPRPEAPADRAAAPVPPPKPTAAPRPENQLSSSSSIAEQEAAPPSEQAEGPPAGQAAPARRAKAADGQQGVTRQPFQGPMLDRTAAEKEVMLLQPAATGEVAQWLSAVRRACETRPADGKIWEELARQGERFGRVSGGNAEPALAAILNLVRSIGGIDDAGAQCPRILEAIDRIMTGAGE